MDPLSAANSILQLLQEIQNVGNNWSLASQEWQDFPGQVEQLQRKLEIWETACINRGLSSNANLNKGLQDVKSLLEEEVRNLNKRTGSCWTGCWPRLCMTLFPAKLGRSIQVLIKAFNDFQEMLRSNEEAGVALDKLVQEVPFSDPITPDSRYVPLDDSEKEVYAALNNWDGPAVILLHGGPGKGKTTLARNIAVQYSKSSQPEYSQYNRVVFLACGPQATAEATQFDLIQRLGCEPSATGTLQDDGKTRAIRIHKQIKALLSTQKVLIILDDVSDAEFLESIVVLCGDRVKCLVTSQEATLCRVLDPSKVHKIQIQDLDIEGARRILASHVGLPDQQIPAHVQEVAEEMIRKTDFNPLALASLANGISYDRSSELVEWEEASTNLLKVLESDVPTSFHGKYPRSFWTTTKLCMDKLPEDSRKLLLLIYACEGPSIPEEVVKLLYRGLASQGGSGTFLNSARDELANRQLVKITTIEDRLSSTSSTINLEKQRKWSVHSLHRLYIEKEMAQDRDSIITSIIDNDRSNEGGQRDSECQIVSESKDAKRSAVLTPLCALYLDKPLASMAETKLRIPAENFSNIRRSAIEPVTLLLGQPLSPRWTEMHHRCVAKVFVRYICDGSLDDSSISHLLGVEIAAQAMCTVLKDIALVEKTCLLNDDTRGLMEVLVSWLAEGLETSKQLAALKVLDALAYNKDHSMFMVSFPGVLDAIVRLLHDTPDSDQQNVDSIMLNSSTFISEIQSPLSEGAVLDFHMQQWAASTLANLAYGGLEIKDKIANHPGVLPALVKSLSKDMNPRFQQQGARALANLAFERHEAKDKIVNHPRILSELVKSLSKDVNPKLQQQAAMALANLAYGMAMTKDKIANHPELLSELVNSLSKDINPKLQQHAATTLANLAYGGLETKDRIANHPGVLLELVNSLSKDENPRLQQHAARALTYLTHGAQIKEKIVNHPRALFELVNSLSKDINPTLQQQAAKVFVNLSRGHRLQNKIANHPGVLSELANSLSKDNNPNLQEMTASALENLAFERGPGLRKDKIVNHPRVLLELVNSLSKDINPNLQEHVAQALANLAYGPSETKNKIVSHPRVLSELAKSLSKVVNPKFQQNVAMALVNLAHGDLEVKEKIVNHPDVLSELVNSLSKPFDVKFSNLQQRVADVLVKLASGHSLEIKDRIANHPGVLSELVKSFSRIKNPSLQEKVICTLGNLAYGGCETKNDIVNHPGVLLALVNSMSKHVNSNLQEEGVRTLYNLAVGTDEIKVQIGNHPGVISELVKSLSKGSNPRLQEKVVWTLAHLARAKCNITRMKATEGIMQGLLGLLSSNKQPRLMASAAFVLTLLDPVHANEEHLRSALLAYEGRITANYGSGDLQQALVDFNKGRELGFRGGLWEDLRVSCALKTKAGDYQAAMVDANGVVNSEDTIDQVFHLQERGALKTMMGDLHGALEVLNEGLAIDID